MAVKLNFAQIGYTEGLLKFLENPLFPNLSSNGTLDVDGEADLGAAVITSGIQTIAANGTTTVADLTKSVIEVSSDAGGDIVTVADGTLGQRMAFVSIVAAGTLTITPATFNGGTSITFNAVADTVELLFGSLGWSIIGGNSYAIS